MAACSCAKCVTACTRTPGWFTPDEATAAIECAVPLMVVNAYGIRILAPAAIGKEGEEVIYRPGVMTFGRCSQLNAMGLCAIHANKPFECRESMPHEGASLKGARMHQYIAHRWASREGAAVLDRFKTAQPLGVS